MLSLLFTSSHVSTGTDLLTQIIVMKKYVRILSLGLSRSDLYLSKLFHSAVLLLVCYPCWDCSPFLLAVTSS